MDPDGFASRFGAHVLDDDFAGGLTHLLNGGEWRDRGERARAYMRDTFELESAIDRHLAVYTELMAERSH